MKDFIKNPFHQGIAIVAIVVILILWVWDEKKNPDKDFFGLLKPKSAAPAA